MSIKSKQDRAKIVEEFATKMLEKRKALQSAREEELRQHEKVRLLETEVGKLYHGDELIQADIDQRIMELENPDHYERLRQVWKV